jgi:hypothetical protein
MSFKCLNYLNLEKDYSIINKDEISEHLCEHNFAAASIIYLCSNILSDAGLIGTATRKCSEKVQNIIKISSHINIFTQVRDDPSFTVLRMKQTFPSQFHFLLLFQMKG